MKSISEVLVPLKLKTYGTANVGRTGYGCFVDVATYLVDDSWELNFDVKALCVRLNDFLKAEDRQKMVPLLERAIMPLTPSQKVVLDLKFKDFRVDLRYFFDSHKTSFWENLKYRYRLYFAKTLADAIKWRTCVSMRRHEALTLETLSFDKSSDWDSSWKAVSSVINHSRSVGHPNYERDYNDFRDLCLGFLNDVLPPSAVPPSPKILARAEKLVATFQSTLGNPI